MAADDASRLASAKILVNETAASAVASLEPGVGWLVGLDVRVGYHSSQQPTSQRGPDAARPPAAGHLPPG